MQKGREAVHQTNREGWEAKAGGKCPDFFAKTNLPERGKKEKL